MFSVMMMLFFLTIFIAIGSAGVYNYYKVGNFLSPGDYLGENLCAGVVRCQGGRFGGVCGVATP